MPIQSTLPSLGTKCGRREGEADAKVAERDPLAEVASQRWKAPRPSGCRLPSREAGATWALVGPYFAHSRSLPLQASAPTTAGVLWKPQEGNVVSVRQAHALEPEGSRRSRPRGHVLRSVQKPVHVIAIKSSAGDASQRRSNVARFDSVSWSGKPAQAGGTGTGTLAVGRMRGSPRLTALRGQLRGARVRRKKRKKVEAFVPARKREPRFMAVRREQLQKSAGGTWPRISSHAALQKEWR